VWNIVDYVAGTLKELLRMQAASNLNIKDVKQRLIRLEDTIKSCAFNLLDNDDSFITQFLPLGTIDNIKEVEAILKTSNESVIQFVSYTFMFLSCNCVLLKFL